MERVRFLFISCSVAALLLLLNACAAPTATPTPPSPVQPTASLATVLASTGVPTQKAPVPTVAVTNTQAPPATQVTVPTAVPPAASTEPAAAPTQPAAPVGTAPTSFFGVNTNGEIFYDDNVRALATLGGVQMVRFSVDWKSIEKTPGEYSWGGTDSLFKTMADNNFAPLILIMNNPDWAANSPCGPVNDMLAFERFIGALVARYPQSKHWALYNEPDNALYPQVSPGGCFGGGDINSNGKPDVQDYAEQLRVAWRAVHKANPEALLLTGALAFDNFEPTTVPSGYPGGGNGGAFNYNFAPQLFQYMQQNPLPNGEKYFDLLSFNFYFVYGAYWERAAGGVSISAKANMLNKLMRDNGVSVPLLVSETGEDTTRVGNAGQSDYMTKTYVRGLASNIQAMIWWTFMDYADSSPPPTNTWKYGLIDQNKTPKPVYSAYQTASHQLTGAVIVQPLEVQGGEAYLFSKDGGGLAVAWSLSESPVIIPFAASKLAVTDMYGVSREISDGAPEDNDGAAGRIGVGINQNPVYIQVVAQ